MTDRDDELRRRAYSVKGWGPERSGHITEVIPRAGSVFEVHCTTCNYRPAEFLHSEYEADIEERAHHRDIAQGVNQIAKRSANMGPSIAHARDMAQRETTPKKEAAEWTRLADEMERQRKVRSRVKSHETLEGQQTLEFPE